MRRMGSAERQRQRAKARRRNQPRKARERARRDARMVATIQGASLPYAPWVMSWLSQKLDKPSKQISQADVEQVLAASPTTASATS